MSKPQPTADGAGAAPLANQDAALEQRLSRLKERARVFARMAIDEKIRLVRQLRQSFDRLSDEMVVAGCRAKGLDPSSQLAGEEWLLGPLTILRNLRLLEGSLEDVAKRGVPKIHRRWLGTLPDGRLSIRVHPMGGLDSTLLPGHEGFVHMKPGVTAKNLKAHQAAFYREPHDGKVCLVLGAGNVAAIPPTDVFYKLFVEGTVCVLKMNPVNAYLGPVFERAMAPLVEQGFVAFVYGGAGESLVDHPLIDELHMTGSDKTYDAIVWGPEEGRAERKRKQKPRLDKRFTAELGNISPVVVLPGPWSNDELDTQAMSVAGMATNNASFNCVSAKMLVMPDGWAGRARFLAKLQEGMAQAPTRKPYYPGAKERWERYTKDRKGLRLLGKPGPDELPWALIPDLDPRSEGEALFHEEPWCPILSETALPYRGDFNDYLDDLTRFLNDRLWGTLCATLIVHPRTWRVHQEALSKLVRTLRYGSVALNTWPGTVFGLMSTPWGGHPSTSAVDVQSGIGFVHNAFMLEGIEKVVVRAPVRPVVAPPWYPNHASLLTLAKRLTSLEASPGVHKVPGLLLAASMARSRHGGDPESRDA